MHNTINNYLAQLYITTSRDNFGHLATLCWNFAAILFYWVHSVFLNRHNFGVSVHSLFNATGLNWMMAPFTGRKCLKGGSVMY